ncbi:unnamed protein product [Phaedon cochleariae]|uniref:Uncharacterized protein n=1 Tax=Phaedon cochleariae TaxID=80249 RepID=A0A9N9X2N0_PHACE|nr:unnamed protein product [Phaedon cochleariae]
MDRPNSRTMRILQNAKNAKLVEDVEAGLSSEKENIRPINCEIETELNSFSMDGNNHDIISKNDAHVGDNEENNIITENPNNPNILDISSCYGLQNTNNFSMNEPEDIGGSHRLSESDSLLIFDIPEVTENIFSNSNEEFNVESCLNQPDHMNLGTLDQLDLQFIGEDREVFVLQNTNLKEFRDEEKDTNSDSIEEREEENEEEHEGDHEEEHEKEYEEEHEQEHEKEHEGEHELRDFSETGENVDKGKRRKRYLVDEAKWSSSINKKRREKGEKYYGKKKVDNEWKYNVFRQKKVIKCRCKCKLSSKKSVLKCGLLTEDERNEIFSSFWSELDWKQRKLYIQLLVNVKTTRRHRHRLVEAESRRKYSWKYHLKKSDERIPVCKTMFLNTLGIGERMVMNWKQAELSEGKSLKSEIDNDNSTVRNDLKENLRLFFREIPKTESHYCRASSSKLYLEPNWTSKSALYNLYKNTWCVEQHMKPLSIAVFYHIFDEMNLSLFRPKKDQCDTCFTYKAGNLSEEAYECHQLKKREARESKAADKESNNKVYCMDLQSVLLCPKSNVSSLYFKTKLIVHNFTIYNMKTKEAYCYLWHESAGGVSSNDYCSIICYFLKQFVIGTLSPDQNIIIYSDGCTSQNRNANLSNALLNMASYYKVTIEQKYLEKGHTQMEADSIHSTIEQRLRRTDINVPADYVGVCLAARRNPSPYLVKYLDYTFFKNFGELKFLSSLRPGKRTGDPVVTDIRALQYSPNGSILYKLRHTDTYTPLLFRNPNKIQPCSLESLPQLYGRPIPIKKDKWDNLQSLKKSLKKDYHSFYDNLPYF